MHDLFANALIESVRFWFFFYALGHLFEMLLVSHTFCFLKILS